MYVKFGQMLPKFCSKILKPKVLFYSARNKNRNKFAMVIKNKIGFAKGMNVFLHVI
jgi:hypothetical protein